VGIHGSSVSTQFVPKQNQHSSTNDNNKLSQTFLDFHRVKIQDVVDIAFPDRLRAGDAIFEIL
jgi:hypothetical protein